MATMHSLPIEQGYYAQLERVSEERGSISVCHARCSMVGGGERSKLCALITRDAGAMSSMGLDRPFPDSRR
jgi:hypothetical protein